MTDVLKDAVPSKEEESSIDDDSKGSISIAGRTARATARNPVKCLIATLVISTIVSVVGVMVGGFTVSADDSGWTSRGTLIADREMQRDLLNRNEVGLFEDTDGSYWEFMENTLHTGYEAIDLEEEAGESDRRKLEGSGSCDTSWYKDRNFLKKDNLFAVWKVEPDNDSSTLSALDKDALSEICVAETNTLEFLEEKGLCSGCDNGKCLPPHSLVLLLRDRIDGGADMNCDQLMNSYTTSVQTNFTTQLVTCTNQMKTSYNPNTKQFESDISACPENFHVNLVDASFGIGGNTQLRHTTSFYNTASIEREKLYKEWENLDTGGGDVIKGAWDTVYESFGELYVDKVVQSDMTLAVASLTVTVVAMGIHTRSAWLTLMGLLQIIYAIPLAYFVYTVIGGLSFFPFLNFIGVFVAAALGADDLFVAVDKWKNARIADPEGTTEDIAERALPDAAGAMFLTTSTTAVAFFATCICPVPPILCFAVFCGLMIVFNYLLNIWIVFPALCLYDIWLQRGTKNFCVSCCAKKKVEEDVNDADVEDLAVTNGTTRPSLIHRLLTKYYDLLHKGRWYVFAACIAAIGFCIYAATTITLPETAEVRLLPESHPLEIHNAWKRTILSSLLFTTGAGVQIVFGIRPGDTGNRNDPEQLSKFLVDDTFDASSQEAQEYLLGFCDRLYGTDFASKPNPDYECAINQFDDWLQDQYSSETENQEDIYKESCNGSSSLPMASGDFDKCLTSWSQSYGNTDVFNKKGKVQILLVNTKASVEFTAPPTVIKEEWIRYEDFLKEEDAPEGVDKPHHTSFMWWWNDTQYQMFETALGAAAIAVAFSTIVVVISSRSLILTFFSACCIVYVLAAATASLVALGWSLGFLESVCFAILVGISCDFIIHFGHAYIHHEGSVSRHERTKFALLHMGPSILAAAVTTVSAALVMFACEVVFFTKFAMLLFLTIVHATVGSFVVYIVLNDLFGPSEPTKFIDGLIEKIRGNKNSNENPDDLVFEEEKEKNADLSLS